MSERRIIRKPDKLSFEDPDHLPGIMVEDGRVYVGGVHVFREHLSKEELVEYFPDEYLNVYGGDLACPMCKKVLEEANGNTLTNHLRTVHREWYDQNHSMFKGYDYKGRGFGPILSKIVESIPDKVTA